MYLILKGQPVVNRIQPYCASRGSSITPHGRVTAQRERTITRVFVFLSDKEQDRVPSIAEKLSLKSSGLGEKTVLHGKDGTNQKCSTACCEYR